MSNVDGRSGSALRALPGVRCAGDGLGDVASFFSERIFSGAEGGCGGAEGPVVMPTSAPADSGGPVGAGANPKENPKSTCFI